MHRRHFIRSAAGAALVAAMPVRAQLFSGAAGEVNAITGAGKQTTLKNSALRDLESSLHGRLLVPGVDGYEKARRVRNAAINKYPSLIVQPTGVADIRNAVNFARDNSLLLAVKGGGHSPGGRSTCDGGMMLDLSTFRYAHVDPKAQTANIAGGSLLGELDHESLSFGLATTAGTVSHTGVGGLTTGGGYGRLARRYGLALDNVKSVEVVTADGRLLRAGADENQDLYWGVRGGGGNFGVVTSFEFKLHPMSRQVIGGTVVFPYSEVPNVIRAFGDLCASAPDELYFGLWLVVPPNPNDGQVGISVCYSGPPEKAERLIAPMRKVGTVISDNVRTVDYEVLQKSDDNYGAAGNHGDYLKSGFTGNLTDQLVDVLVAGIEPGPQRTIQLSSQQCGGAVSRIPTKSTAFSHRDAQLNFMLTVSTPIVFDPKANVAYARKYWESVEPHLSGFYTPIISDGETQGSVDSNYKENFPRLLALKKRYDPENLFRLNANIDPSLSSKPGTVAQG